MEGSIWGEGSLVGQRVPSGERGSLPEEGELGPPPRSRTWALKSGPPCPHCRDFQALSLREALEQVVADECSFSSFSADAAF